MIVAPFEIEALSQTNCINKFFSWTEVGVQHHRPEHTEKFGGVRPSMPRKVLSLYMPRVGQFLSRPLDLFVAIICG